MFKRILILCCSLLLTACYPIYETTYNLTPPSSQEGLYCVNSCLAVQQNCNIACMQTQNNCESLTETRRMISSLNESSTYSSYSDYSRCKENKSRCDASCRGTYHQCYQNCGGAVQSETKCVLNCDKQQPKPRYKR